MRQRASGRRRSAPNPEHGASSSTRSNDCGRNGGAVPSAPTICISFGLMSRRSRLLDNNVSRDGRISAATTIAPSATSAVALPPGAAHTSSTRSPGCASTAAATSCEPSSWMYPSSRVVTTAASFIASSAAMARSTPRSSVSRFTIHSG